MKNFYYMILFAAAILFAGCNNKGNEPTLPTNAYLKGYKIYKMPERSKYYTVAILPETINDDYMTTITTPISDKLIYEDLPYTKMCVDPIRFQELAYIKNYRVSLANGDNQSIVNMMSCAQWDLNPYSITDECILTSADGKAQIGLLFDIER